MSLLGPIHLADRYATLRRRVVLHVPDGCSEITLRLPESFDGELAFYRLVNWAYVLVNEAAKNALPFLVSLPPLRTADIKKKEIECLRTYLNHNLGQSRRDVVTASAAQTWLRQACGRGSPRKPEEFSAASNTLAQRLCEILEGAIDACDLLDDPIDGPSLVSGLMLRITQNWDAHRFDPIVMECVEIVGNPGLDLIKFRNRRLDAWRATVKSAAEDKVISAIRIQIEADLLDEFEKRLPIEAKNIRDSICVEGTEATVAALLLLRGARVNNGTSIIEILRKMRK